VDQIYTNSHEFHLECDRVEVRLYGPSNLYSVDDMTVCWLGWKLHLQHVEQYLLTIRDAGMTLNLKKCQMAKRKVKFVGHIIRSGTHRADPDKIQAVLALKVPETKQKTGETDIRLLHALPSIADLTVVRK